MAILLGWHISYMRVKLPSLPALHGHEYERLDVILHRQDPEVILILCQHI